MSAKREEKNNNKAAKNVKTVKVEKIKMLIFFLLFCIYRINLNTIHDTVRKRR